MPVLLHSISQITFMLSGVVTLVLLFLFLRLLRSVTGINLDTRRRTLIGVIAGIFLAINLLYFLNLIPPIPLSLRDASVYHAIARSADGNYSVQSENPGVFRFFRPYETFHAMPGASAYVYSAIFSPTALNTTMIHQWQFYDTQRGWTNMGPGIPLQVRGGRGEGYRTYSMKTGITQGAWRVNVQTPSGALLGRLRFNVILQPNAPTLITQIKN
jgi:Protein of unknown function (DUF2914)